MKNPNNFQSLRFIAVCLAMFLWQLPIQAQISGIIKNATNKEPIAYATIVVYSQNDTSGVPYQGCFSDETGSFSLQSLPNGAYKMGINALEYEQLLVKNIQISSLNQKLEMGELLLKPAEIKLETVLIEAQKTIIENKGDKIVYHVENDKFTKGNSAFEIIGQVPFISVNQNDQILVKGKSLSKVYVNGKVSGILSRNTSDILKAFPANAIKKIEVITSPSAKYDADGSSYIINIVLKTQIHGHSSGVNIGGGSLKQLHGGFETNIKQGNMGIVLYSGINSSLGVPMQFVTHRKSLSYPNVYTQDIYSTYLNKRLGGYGALELAYDFDSLKTISIYANPYLSKSNASKNGIIHQCNEQSALASIYDFSTLAQNNLKSSDMGADYIQKFGNTNSEHQLSTSFWFNSVKNTDKNVNTNSGLGEVRTQYKNQNIQQTNEMTVVLDYVKPLQYQQKLSLGAKYILRNNNSLYTNYNFDTINQRYEINPILSNYFTLKQNIVACYAEYNIEINKWTIRPGIRFEYTYNTERLQTVQNAIRTKYYNLIPTFTALYNASPSLNMRFSYSKRIQRPSLWYLNPYTDNSNPLIITKGNPYLVPERTHTLEFSINKVVKATNLNVSFYQNFQDKLIADITYFKQQTGISSTNYYNIGNALGTGLTANLSGTLIKKIRYTLNTFVEYQYLQNKQNTVAMANKGVIGNISANLRYSLPFSIQVKANGNIWFGELNLQGRSGIWYQYGMGINKSFFNDKLIFTLSAQNFLQKYIRSTTTTSSDNFESRSEIIKPIRNINFSLNYNFGSLESQVSRKKGVYNEDIKQGK